MIGGAAGVDLRLLPAAVAAWPAGWWAVTTSPGRAGAVAAAGSAFCLALLPGARSRRWAAVLALALAAASAVLAAAAASGSARAGGPLPGWAGQRLTAEITGRVSGDPRRLAAGSSGPAERYLVRLVADTGTARGRRHRLAAPVMVLGGAQWAAAGAGQRVTARGRLQPPRPGQEAAAWMYATGPPQTRDAGWWPWRVAPRLRDGLVRACHGLPPDAAGLLPALTVGDTSNLPDGLRDDLRTAGLTHLTAVSGANVAIVCGAVLVSGAALGAGRRLRLVLTAGALAGFVVLARPEPSVLRAAVMGGIGLIGLAGARAGRGVPALAGSVVVLLVADPWLARSYGFALSVLATAGLLLLAPAWVERLERWMPRAPALLLAAPAAALAVTAPVTVLLQPSISLVSVPANLVAGPAVAPATVLGVLAALAWPLWPPAATLLAGLGALATGWIAVTAHRAAAVPGAAMPWLPGVSGGLLLAGLVLLLVVATTARRRRARRRPLPRWPPAVLVLAVAAGWAIGPRLALGGAARWPPPGWQAVMCEVGQGDALVLRSGPDSAVLVDAGPTPDLIDGCLRRLLVRRLDLVVLTHYHADHVGGIGAALAGRGSPDVLVSPLARPVANVEQVRRAVLAGGSRLVVAGDGLAGATGAGRWRLQWQVLWPRLPTADASDDDGSAVNDSSVIMLVQTPRLRLAALGDVEADAQRLLAPRLAGLAPVDVVKVAHHGSASQHGRLYAELRPRVALIGVGLGNDYGHPAPRTLGMLRSNGAVVQRTDTDGDLAVVGSAGGLSLRTAHHGHLSAPRGDGHR